MCPGDNSAALSVRYLNAQLTAMWQNAAECVGHEGKKSTVDLRAADYIKHKYTRSLAQFHYIGDKPPKGSISKEALFFDGSFGEPRLEFICNHDVALYFKLESGHFNKVYPTKANVKGYKPNKKDNVPFENLEIAFRLRFSRSNLTGKDSRIGNGVEHQIQMMILDFSSAQMVLFKPDLPLGTADALEWYLKKYLVFLQSAGQHVRFDLPDFDDDEARPHIDYSLMTRALEHEELCAHVSVHGISEAKINEFLRETWLDVVSKAQGFGGSAPTDKLASCLTEVQSTWVGHLDSHFHLRFNPPRVRVLCSHEVVMYFTTAAAHFHQSEDFDHEPTQSFSDWDFAFIVTVVEDKIGEAHGLKLDLSTARFCQHLSTTVAQEDRFHFTEIINFLETHYIELLAAYKMHSIFYPGGYRGGDPTKEPDFDDIDDFESDWRTGEEEEAGHKTTGTVVWTETVKTLGLKGYDHVVAVSEVSLNALFESLRRTAIKARGCLAEWHYKESFRADFMPLRVKLLSGNKALVTFTINDGFIYLKDKRKKYEFTSWTIAYEVDVKMVDQTELQCNEGWFTRFAHSIFGTHGHEETTTVRHIILDFSTAKYIYKHSSMPGMWDSGSLSAVDTLKSFIHYMEKYLVELSMSGYNIIHSTPIFPHTHGFGLTAATFQIISKTTVTIMNCMFEHEAPVIMVLGMMRGRPLPTDAGISWGSGWVIPTGGAGAGAKSTSHGTICLSRESFLEGKLLVALELVNRRTTVVPRFPEENEEEWQVYLTTWDQHRYRKNKVCKWKKDEKVTDGWLMYGWEFRDEWTYDKEGTFIDASGYAVLCQTKNQLCIPTTYNSRSLDIVLRGESVLRLRGKDEKQLWSKRSSAKWSVKIQVYSERSGLRVAVAEEVHPVFDQTHSEGHWDIDTHKLLADQLPHIVDLKEVVQELKQVFEGAWEYSAAGLKTYNLASPVFNENGDLIVQLGSFTESSAVTQTSTTSTENLTMSSTPRVITRRSLLGRVKDTITGHPKHNGSSSSLKRTDSSSLKRTDSMVSTSSSLKVESPAVMATEGNGNGHSIVENGSEKHLSYADAVHEYLPTPKMEITQLAPSAAAAGTATPGESTVAAAGF
ncbi:hypothetical protein R3P38DRAFT_320807 [Favolaschia claudopus]|uniref:Uncharacterized protein n=1 Tax=Favolaschia claudopus TaxID=2862362 RepID=A0AAW0CUI4_9AGAR